MLNLFMSRIYARLDAKGRVVIPANYRKILGDCTSLVGRMNPDNTYLVVYTEKAWEDKVLSLQSILDEWNEEHNDLMMQFMDDAVELPIDSQSRILIPKSQKERMGIGSDVVFVGMNDRFAIWDKNTYDKHSSERKPFAVPAKS